MFDRTIAEAVIKPDCISNFWQAVDIYLFKTHVVNKKLFGVKNVLILPYKNAPPSAEETSQATEHLLDQIAETELDSFEHETRKRLLCLGCEVREQKVDNISLHEVSQQEYDGAIVLNRLLPKNINVFQPIDVACWIGVKRVLGLFIYI